MKTVRINIPSVPEDQHRQIKVAAAMQGVTLQQFMVSAALAAATKANPKAPGK